MKKYYNLMDIVKREEENLINNLLSLILITNDTLNEGIEDILNSNKDILAVITTNEKGIIKIEGISNLDIIDKYDNILNIRYR